MFASKGIDLATELVMSEHMELQHLMDIGSAPHDKSNIFKWLQSKAGTCPYLGILLATLSSLFFSMCSVIVKQLVDINPMELAMFRCVQLFFLPLVMCHSEIENSSIVLFQIHWRIIADHSDSHLPATAIHS